MTGGTPQHETAQASAPPTGERRSSTSTREHPGSATATFCATAALLLGVLALTGCGESAQAKAKKQVCSARSDISKQIANLQGLTLSSSSAATAKASFEAIGKDVTTIKNAQKNLDSTRRQQVETATSTFVSQVNSIASGLTSNPSGGNAEAQFKSAISQLGTAYTQTLGPISC